MGIIGSSDRIKLTDAQRAVYKSEEGYNFREIARLLVRRSGYTLTAADIISKKEPSESASSSPSLIARLAAWGEFAEIALGELDPAFIIREIGSLSEPGGPYEAYRALAAPGVRCLGVFQGPGRKGVQGYVAFRPGSGKQGGEGEAERNEHVNDEVVVTFSGTCNVWHVFQDMDVRRAVYPVPSTTEKTPSARVHKGFWRLYTGLRPAMAKILSSALEQYPTADLVLTGHSLGAAMCYLLAMDVLLGSGELGFGVNDKGANEGGRKITLAAFGCPRIGDSGLVKVFVDAVAQYRKKYGENSFEEYSIKAFDDGAHCLPQHGFGYRHICQSPFYLYHGDLYRIPAGDAESSYFKVDSGDHTDKAAASLYPLGGHNYYNNRNMEKPMFFMKKLKLKTLGEEGWEERYQKLKAQVVNVKN
ncbi:alpha/beta-hydrolase [Schizopora paradoxa]|uniref:Alpha/beta-hydrolase n=1 Tax=Schizopora paradoxa TaxID=27342 RepID=A0A0H2R567_9AGAM|nr:alpha/beta-hydrolase [Schizopora paradoxa]